MHFGPNKLQLISLHSFSGEAPGKLLLNNSLDVLFEASGMFCAILVDFMISVTFSGIAVRFLSEQPTFRDLEEHGM